jgi:hypothetical protein
MKIICPRLKENQPNNGLISMILRIFDSLLFKILTEIVSIVNIPNNFIKKRDDVVCGSIFILLF